MDQLVTLRETWPAGKPPIKMDVSRCEHHLYVPPGKLTKNYGKSPCLMGKSSISMAISIAMLAYQGIMLDLSLPFLVSMSIAA